MTKPDFSPDHHHINSLIVALLLGAIPHFIYQPFWVGLMFVVMISWRLLHSYRGWPLPAASRWLKVLHNGGAALTIVLIFTQFGLTIGRDSGAALLTIMLAFKVVEIRSLRDYYVSCFLGFFLVITNFFYSQSLMMVVLMFAVIILLTGCLVSVNSSHDVQGIKQRLRLALKMVFQAMPVMLFLFLLFPRIPGPIWGLPKDANSNVTTTMTEQITLGEIPSGTGTSGISDSIQMGKISQLILSDETAFRVQFENDTIPPSSQLYWRGPVLWHTDGTVWSPLAPKHVNKQSPQITHSGSQFSYSMTLEPHNKRWLFALDFPTQKPTSFPSYLSSDGRLNSQSKIKNRSQYALSSSTDYRFNAEGDNNLWAALQLPKDKHPQTLALAEKWRQETDNKFDYIDSVLRFFNTQNFVYSLTPPQLSGDIVDMFLFDSREGFCEHYAASFTVLMRAADIPARIVTGYQGGDLNPVDNVLTVRQRDAHAWTEVWLKDQGWIRIDPTSAVSSQRVEQGISGLLPNERNSPRILSQSDALTQLWQHMENNWDAFNNSWDIWVVGYGPQIQKQVLSKLGMNNPDWKKMTIWLASLLLLSGLVMVLASLYRRRDSDPAVAIYQTFCRKMAKIGLTKHDYEGPHDFALRAQYALPDYQLQIHQITTLYSHIRYRHEQPLLLEELAQKVKAFRPQK